MIDVEKWQTKKISQVRLVRTAWQTLHRPLLGSGQYGILVRLCQKWLVIIREGCLGLSIYYWPEGRVVRESVHLVAASWCQEG
jgi:hypothetical protein